MPSLKVLLPLVCLYVSKEGLRRWVSASSQMNLDSSAGKLQVTLQLAIVGEELEHAQSWSSEYGLHIGASPLAGC